MQPDIDVGGAELNKGRLLASALLAGALLAPSVSTSTVGFAAQGVPLGGSGSLQTGAFSPSGSGDATNVEFPGGLDNGGGAAGYQGTIYAQSSPNSQGGREGGFSGAQGDEGDSGIAGPRFVAGFEGLNHFQNRFARGGNQFSLEPPDQGLCVGNGFVVEPVNDVINVFNTSGKSLLPDNTATNIVAGHPTDVNHAVDLNSFYGYPPAIDRKTGIRGQFVTDPSCLFDKATQRWFVVVLTLEQFAKGGFTTVNHLDLAVSKTADPTGAYNIYRIDVTNDGSNPDQKKNACPCIGDYPHIGADANGFYITTNSYPFTDVTSTNNGFDGAQIYAFSKAQLAAGAPVVAMQHLDTFGKVKAPSDAGATQPGFTLWPSQSPGGSLSPVEDNSTEFFLSSNAADEANTPVSGVPGPRTSTQLVAWALSNTVSLNSTPDLKLSNKILSVGRYAVPPKQKQPGSGKPPTQSAPQGFCINDTTTATVLGKGCWNLLFFPPEPAHNEVLPSPDSNDTRMQQVTFADGQLFGALDTSLTVGGKNRAGIEFFVVDVRSDDGGFQPSLARSGYLGAPGMDFVYPAIGVTQDGRGVMAFTATGDKAFPSAAFAPFDARRGVGKWNFVPGGQGAAPDDGFTGYKAQVAPNPINARWGDYGAAAIDGSSVWIGSEYIAHTCNYQDWGGRFFGATTGDNKLGTCAASPGAPGVRTALANWSTRISQFKLEGGN